MQSELEEYIREYSLGPGDTQRRPEKVSEHTTVVQQMKTVRYNSMAPVRKESFSIRACQSQNYQVKAGNISRQSVCTHLNVNEIKRESEEGLSEYHEPASHPKLESIIFDGSQQVSGVGESTMSIPPKVATVQVLPKPARNPVPKWIKRTLQGILLTMSIGIVFLCPNQYAFLRSIFMFEESYLYTYRPPLPGQTKLMLPLFVASFCYLVLFIVYLVRKFLHGQSKITQLHMRIAAAAHTLLQLIVLFMWLDGLKLSGQVYQRFQDDPNYEDHAVVALLLRWRTLWISNTIVFLLNFVGLGSILALVRWPKK